MKRYLILATSLMLALMFVISCSSEQAAEVSASSALDFKARDVDGELHSSSEWIGKQPVVINIWGTWCPPCRKEIPDLVRLYGEYKSKGIEFVGLALERRAGPADVKAFAAQNNMEWIMLMAEREHAVQFNATGVPKTILIDRHGKVMQVTDAAGRVGNAFVGPQPYHTFKAAFDKLLEI